MTTEVTTATFDAEVLKSDKPVLVDFWAPWCGPCRGMAPVVDELAKDRATTMKVVKLNVDENKETSDQYSIRGIPAFLMFREGKVIGSITGSRSKTEFYKWADETAALPATNGQTADEFKTASAAAEKDTDSMGKIIADTMKGGFGKAMFGISSVNHALTIAGGLIIAATSTVAAAPLAGTVAVAAGMYRIYNAVTNRAALKRDGEEAMKKAMEDSKNMSKGKKLLNAAVGLALGAGVLATGVILLGTVGHFGFLASASAVLLGGKMALGGAVSTLFHGAALINARPTPTEIAEAVGPVEKKPEPQPAPQPAPQPTVAPVATTAPVTQQFEAAAAAKDKAPEAAPAVKAPEVKPPAPPQA